MAEIYYPDREIYVPTYDDIVGRLKNMVLGATELYVSQVEYIVLIHNWNDVCKSLGLPQIDPDSDEPVYFMGCRVVVDDERVGSFGPAKYQIKIAPPPRGFYQRWTQFWRDVYA